MTSSLHLTLMEARRLAVRAQALSGERPAPDRDGILAAARALRCIQLDPLSTVARSHRLVMFSRVGVYDPAVYDRVAYDERHMFEYWAHCASLVLTEDLPIHAQRMRGYLKRKSLWGDRTRVWAAQNDKLRRYVLGHIRRHGPTLSRDLEEDGLHPEAWVSTGWTSGRNISRMLDYLWLSGAITVTARQGGQKVWDLNERVLPEWAPRQRYSERRTTALAIEHALRALGPATARHIQNHFVRGRYPEYPAAFQQLRKAGRVLPVTVAGMSGEWWLHADQVGWVDERVAPRTVLLSPFDNLIADRARTEALFGFEFRIEIYVPVAKRKFGYYVLPILHGERLIGRIDPQFERETGTLRVNAVYAEPGAPREAGPAVAGAIRELAGFLSARNIVIDKRRTPALWRAAM
ncbi:MAG: YcaQ family DNA glycosylase [Anaerolineales bacterium]|nr:YcaQ family DNA glycosylase [Anaerolineales bacterium]